MVCMRRGRVALGLLAYLSLVAAQDLQQEHGGAQGSTALSELESERTIDFGQNGEPTATGRFDVISGRLEIKGEFGTGAIFDLVVPAREALLNLCGPDAAIYGVPQSEAASYGLERQGMFYVFDLLVPAGGTGPCLHKLVTAGYGAPEPPFEGYKRPKPPLRTGLFEEMDAEPSTKGIDPTTWCVQLTALVCQEYKVNRPTWMPEAAAEPELENMCGSFNHAGETFYLWKEAGDSSANCERQPNACACLDKGSCSWVKHSSGGMRCVSTPDNPVVACEDCANQPHCPVPTYEICASEWDPCGCALKYKPDRFGRLPRKTCRWDTSEDKCAEDLAESRIGTPCSICAEQGHCSPPKVRTVQPPRGDIWQNRILSKHSWHGHVINVTFDREVKLKDSATREALSGVTFECDPTRLEEEQQVSGLLDALWAPPKYQVPLASLTTHSIVNGTLLVVDVLGVANTGTRKCNLVLNSGSVRSLEDDTPLLKFPTGSYWFAIGDTAKPELGEISPRNGEYNVDLRASFRVGFSELVQHNHLKKPTPALQLQALSSDSGGSLRDLSLNVPLDSDVVTFDKDGMTVNLAGFLEPGVLYSVTLPPGGLIDPSGNEAPGITDFYTFKTGRVSLRPVKRNDFEVSSNVVIGVVVAVCLLVVMSVCTCIVVCKMQSARSRLDMIGKEVDESAMASSPSGGSNGWFGGTGSSWFGGGTHTDSTAKLPWEALWRTRSRGRGAGGGDGGDLQRWDRLRRSLSYFGSATNPWTAFQNWRLSPNASPTYSNRVAVKTAQDVPETGGGLLPEQKKSVVSGSRPAAPSLPQLPTLAAEQNWRNPPHTHVVHGRSGYAQARSHSASPQLVRAQGAERGRRQPRRARSADRRHEYAGSSLGAGLREYATVRHDHGLSQPQMETTQLPGGFHKAGDDKRATGPPQERAFEPD
eukprot:TRINITY_DN91842_c0_g1_i1.p1 TRINITY_DN91842_c0_g1~~TRINITY_DN91842_c0_g1_i1.p1  ORF type:complete len:929 (+),score=138.23 TRINITY_DN91842_c0_g1_i1:197-2983(+)